MTEQRRQSASSWTRSSSDRLETMRSDWVHTKEENSAGRRNVETHLTVMSPPPLASMLPSGL